MNILFVEDKNVLSPSYGAEQRSNLLLRACCKIAHVDLVLFKKYQITSSIENCQIVYENDMENHLTHWDKIKKLLSFNLGCVRTVNHKQQEIISKLLCKKNYDYIVVRYVPKAIQYGLLKYADRLVIDIDDNPITGLINQLKLPSTSKIKKIYLKIKLPFVKKAYCNIINQIKVPFVSNIEDAKINESKCVHLPNVSFTESVVDLCDFSNTTKRVIWVGLVNYPPNYMGLEHFFEYIYPKVLLKIPDFEVVIVGKYGDYDISKWKKLQGVSVKGFVEDLEHEYSLVRAAIVPCYSGAGTNIKVLEAMRMKRPCITSEFGSRGYDNYFENNHDYLVCKNDEEFVASIIDMLENENRNHTISYNGFEKVSKFFSKDSFMNIVISVFNKLSNK